MCVHVYVCARARVCVCTRVCVCACNNMTVALHFVIITGLVPPIESEYSVLGMEESITDIGPPPAELPPELPVKQGSVSSTVSCVTCISCKCLRYSLSFGRLTKF